MLAPTAPVLGEPVRAEDMVVDQVPDFSRKLKEAGGRPRICLKHGRRDGRKSRHDDAGAITVKEG